MLAVIYLDLGTPELAIAGERFALIEKVKPPLRGQTGFPNGYGGLALRARTCIVALHRCKAT